MGQKAFIPQEYDVFAGLDVDKKSISVTFSNHQQGFVRSLHMPYSVERLLKHVRKHFPAQKVAFVYDCLLYTSPSPRDRQKSRMPSSA